MDLTNSTADPTQKLPAIVLKPVKEQDAMAVACRFGGHPRLPNTIAWPIDTAGRPMHHLMQIDCAALPVVDADFPRQGTLFVFITGSYDEEDAPDLGYEPGASALIYAPESVSTVPPRPHPEDVPPLGRFSYALKPIVIPVEPKPQGFFAKLIGAQPEESSKETGYFAPVALEPLLFDSHPSADPIPLYQALDKPVTEETALEGIRPHQMFGYAPRAEDLNKLDAEGYMTASAAKADAALALAQRRESEEGDDAPLLLFQLSTCAVRNLDLIRDTSVDKFLITRRDLRARAFEKHWVINEDLYKDGAWRSPKLKPRLYEPKSEEIQPSFVLKPLVPGEPASSPSNFFCGWPQLPNEMRWPVTSDGRKLHFLMQLDCATIPRELQVDGRVLTYPPFPEQGTLFVFVDAFADEMFPDSVKVLFTPTATADLPFREPPEDLAQLRVQDDYRTLGPRRSKVPQSLQGFADTLSARSWEPRLPFQPIAYHTFLPADDHDDYEAVRAAQDEALSHALPHEDQAIRSIQFVLGWLPNWHAMFLAERHSTIYRRGDLRNVPESYPWRWADIREATEGFFSHSLFRRIKEPDEAQAKAHAYLWQQDTVEDVRRWYARSLEHDFLDRIPTDIAGEFRSWLVNLDGARDKIPKEHNEESFEERSWRLDLERAFLDVLGPFGEVNCETTCHWLLHDPESSDYPDQMRQVVANMLRFERSYTELPADNVQHSPSPHQLFAPPDFEHEKTNEVLLLEIASGYGLRTSWGDANPLRLWIEPEDLAGRRFDRIRPEFRW